MSNDPFNLDNFETPPTPEAPNQARSGGPQSAVPPPYIEALNAPQKEAVEATEGPVLVLAGAGTGKTRVLTSRLTHLLATGRAAPGQILSVTFTNKAAHEMKERVARMLGRPVEGMAIGTFHSVAARFLRQHAELVGLESSFTILDTDDQIRLLKQIVSAENIDDKRWPAKQMAGLIDRWKNKALTPDRVPENESYAYGDGLGRKIYAQYQDRLKTLNACDFGDLILHMLTILQTKPDILAQYHARYKYILVDEYQDTNLVQYLWLRLLAQGSGNICCVGDDDQSIYGWRGAEIGNILKFEKDFPGAKIVRLEQNYRSTKNILAAASGLIASNSGRLGKTLWTEGENGPPVRVQAVWDGREEARWIGEEVENLQRKGSSLDQMAVLVRAGFQTREFEERFITLGLPYRVIGGPRFYERKEIRDALAYIRVVAQPADDLALERIINTPKRGLGDATIQKIHQLSRAHNIPMTRAARQLCETDGLRPQARTSLKGLMDDFDRWRDNLQHMNHAELAEMILDESGYTAMWQADKAADAPGRLDNLMELVRAMAEFENLSGFLEHVSLVMENAAGGNMEQLSIMTMHAAKGLEFDHVFLPGWEEGVFPNQRALDDSGLTGLEEERRLAYVGLTRARQSATIVYAGSRQLFGQWQDLIPSRFLDDLPEDHVERHSNLGYSGDSGYASGYGGGYSRVQEDSNYTPPSGGSSPGWQRATSKGYTPGQGYTRGYTAEKNEPTRAERIAKNRPPIIEGQARKATASRAKPTIISDFAIGERVFHEKFGYGLIEDIDGNKLEVNFEHSGSKKIMDNFVERA